MSENLPVVSVIMPMHNSAKFVAASIGSVIAQTYPHWELLVIDDFSSDDSTKIVDKYVAQDARIRLLRNQQHNGMPSAPRNCGVEAARGRYIAFLDSDDLWFPLKLEQQLKFFETHPSVAVVFSDYEKMDEDGRRKNRIIKAPSSVNYHQLLYSNFIGNLTGMYDTSKVGKVRIQDIHHEDYVMWLHILKQGYTAQNTGTVLAAYRVGSQSISSNKLKILLWQWDIYRQVEHLSVQRSLWYYLSYAWRAFFKSII